MEKRVSLILIDDKKGRKAAKREGLNIIGTLTVLLKAKEKGLIPEVKKYLDMLVERKIRISTDLYEYVLKEADE